MRPQSSFGFAILIAGLFLTPVITAQVGRGAPPAPPAPPAAPAPPASPAPPQAPSSGTTAFRIDLVLTRSQGEKRISSLPYSFVTTNTGGFSQFRVGSQVPVPGSTTPGTFSYRNIGMNLDVREITPLPDGRYRLTLNLDDSSVLEASTPAERQAVANAPGPIIRSNSFAAGLIMRDGQAQQFSLTTDKISGETMRAELTLTVLR